MSLLLPTGMNTDDKIRIAAASVMEGNVCLLDLANIRSITFVEDAASNQGDQKKASLQYKYEGLAFLRFTD